MTETWKYLQLGAGLLGIISLVVGAYLWYAVLIQIHASEFIWFYFVFMYTTVIVLSVITIALNEKTFEERVDKYMKKRGVRTW